MSAHGVLATVRGVALVGLEPREIRVEASLTPGVPVLRMVGLPDASVREAGDRVRTALQRVDLRWPQERIVVNLAPAELPKVGSAFDLPLALAILVASRQLPADAVADLWACGEVGLDGGLRAMAGALPLAAGARALGARRLMVPQAVAAEAALATGVTILPMRDLREVVAVLRDERRARPAPDAHVAHATGGEGDLEEVRGQPLARRAVEIAAAGGHHLLLSGPPGCGKTMLARRLHGVLPALTHEAALEVASIASVAGERTPDDPLSLVPPRREPHHSISLPGLIGGGSGVPRPGEIALAHRGMLLFDELLEAPRAVLDALRQPLERGRVELIRSRARVVYPARLQLVAATNPCPCGYLGHPERACSCRPDQVARYRARLSGPLLDRLDLQVELRPVGRAALHGPSDGDPSAQVAARVAEARSFAAARSATHVGVLNRDLPATILRAAVGRGVLDALGDAVVAVGGSARAFERTLRVARTIADLAGAELIGREHVDEAIGYRLPAVAVAT